MEEQACIRLAQDGDMTAFRMLYEGHKQRIFSLAYRYLRNQADAEDVLQETFIKAHHSLPRYTPEKSLNFASWLNKICVNSSIDALRKNRGKSANSLENDEVARISDPSNTSNPVRSTENTEIREKVKQALESLSPKQRLIFIMRHYQEYSVREIAGFMEVTEGSVKKHLFRAAGLLKKRLRHFVTEDRYEMQNR
jgi:RNA polymerase sigma-70 factor (ECF subfamily)